MAVEHRPDPGPVSVHLVPMRRRHLRSVGSPEERDRRYPLLSGQQVVYPVSLSVPLIVEGERLGAMGLGIAWGTVHLMTAPEPACRGGEERIRTVWNGDQRTAIATAF